MPATSHLRQATADPKYKNSSRLLERCWKLLVEMTIAYFSSYASCKEPSSVFDIGMSPHIVINSPFMT